MKHLECMRNMNFTHAVIKQTTVTDWISEGVWYARDMHVWIRYDTLHLHAPFKCLKISILPPPHTHTDSVVVGIILTCVILLFMITLTVWSCCFVYKSDDVKKDLPVVITDLKCSRKDIKHYWIANSYIESCFCFLIIPCIKYFEIITKIICVTRSISNHIYLLT